MRSVTVNVSFPICHFLSSNSSLTSGHRSSSFLITSQILIPDPRTESCATQEGKFTFFLTSGESETFGHFP